MLYILERCVCKNAALLLKTAMQTAAEKAPLGSLSQECIRRGGHRNLRRKNMQEINMFADSVRANLKMLEAI